MFLENKYTNWYFRIITHSKNNVNKIIQEGPYETHHIIPRSFGGDNSSDNLVQLTPRAHFICHLLLTKMTEGHLKSKMVYSLVLMKKNKGRYLSRDKVSKASYDMGRFYKDIEFTEEHRKNLSIAARNRENKPLSEDHKNNISKSMKGKKKDPSHVEKYASAQRGKKRDSWGSHSDEAKEKLSKLHKGKPKTEEHKAKMREAFKNRKKLICPHCQKEGQPGMMTRWHMDNCKLRLR